MRNLKVMFLGTEPVILALRQDISALMNIIETQVIMEADVVISASYSNLSDYYMTDVQYIVVGFEGRSNLPDNVKSMVPTCFADMIKYLSLSQQELCQEEEVSAVQSPSDALRILVVDDSRKHQQSAAALRARYKVVVAPGYQLAMQSLKSEKFDIVLTDLYLPMSANTLGPESFKMGELVPYGLLLMCEAARRGAKHVAIVTDLNHHKDPISAAFDHFGRFALTIEEAIVRMLHASFNSDGSKNWGEALSRLLDD